MIGTIRTALERKKEAGMSYSQIARASGVDASQITRFVRGERDLSLGAVDKLLPFLDITVSRGHESIPDASTTLKLEWERMLQGFTDGIVRDWAKTGLNDEEHLLLDGLAQGKNHAMIAKELECPKADVDYMLGGIMRRFRKALTAALEQLAKAQPEGNEGLS